VCRGRRHGEKSEYKLQGWAGRYVRIVKYKLHTRERLVYHCQGVENLQWQNWSVFFCHRVWEELINGVKIEVDVKMLFLLSPVRKVWIINWQNIIFAAFFGCVSFIGFCMNSDTEEWRKKMDKERGRICSYRTASDLLNSNILMTSTLGKYFVQLSKL
jgi:hypothetical protein